MKYFLVVIISLATITIQAQDYDAAKVNKKAIDAYERATFYKGLFQQTLPGFIKKFDNSRRNVIMLDADLFSATLYALSSLAPYLKKDDIIFFDEFVVPTHEFKAYQDFITSHYVNLKLVAAANNYYFVAFKVV